MFQTYTKSIFTLYFFIIFFSLIVPRLEYLMRLKIIPNNLGVAKVFLAKIPYFQLFIVDS